MVFWLDHAHGIGVWVKVHTARWCNLTSPAKINNHCPESFFHLLGWWIHPSIKVDHMPIFYPVLWGYPAWSLRCHRNKKTSPCTGMQLHMRAVSCRTCQWPGAQSDPKWFPHIRTILYKWKINCLSRRGRLLCNGENSAISGIFRQHYLQKVLHGLILSSSLHISSKWYEDFTDLHTGGAVKFMMFLATSCNWKDIDTMKVHQDAWWEWLALAWPDFAAKIRAVRPSKSQTLVSYENEWKMSL